VLQSAGTPVQKIPVNTGLIIVLLNQFDLDKPRVSQRDADCGRNLCLPTVTVISKFDPPFNKKRTKAIWRISPKVILTRFPFLPAIFQVLKNLSDDR